jgi:hypothetical protein
VNHYERLKVSPDAPAEVIRAAYRALAAKLHPDRQGSETGPEDAMHGQMAALNAAYEVLIDPKSRREYDATLASAAPRVALESVLLNEDVGQVSANRVDMDWLTPKAATAPTFWPPSQRMMILGGGGLAIVILMLSSLMWKAASQHEVERALSGQYVAQPVGGKATQMPAQEGSLPPDPVANQTSHQATTVQHRPSADELVKMSDEELVKLLPALDGQTPEPAVTTASSRSRRARNDNVHHPLDGKPLGLRTDTNLIEQLPSDGATPSKRRP